MQQLRPDAVKFIKKKKKKTKQQRMQITSLAEFINQTFSALNKPLPDAKSCTIPVWSWLRFQ